MKSDATRTRVVVAVVVVVVLVLTNMRAEANAELNELLDRANVGFSRLHATNRASPSLLPLPPSDNGARGCRWSAARLVPARKGPRHRSRWGAMRARGSNMSSRLAGHHRRKMCSLRMRRRLGLREGRQMRGCRSLHRTAPDVLGMGTAEIAAAAAATRSTAAQQQSLRRAHASA
jgi:hypothetical protein